MCAIKDIFLACCSIGSRVFSVVLADLRDLFANSDELDLRWAIESVLNDAITWCTKMTTAQQLEGSNAATYFQEFIDALSAMLSEGPTHLSKASLMFAIDDLEAHSGVGSHAQS